MASSEGKEHLGLSGEETSSMKKGACEKGLVKNRAVLDTGDAWIDLCPLHSNANSQTLDLKQSTV